MIRVGDIPEWVDGAVCASTDPELFHPEKGAHGHARDARKVCAGCDALDRCREYAIDHPELDGIWGGMTKVERARVRARRGAGVAA